MLLIPVPLKIHLLRFHSGYFLLTLLLFITEVIIALFIRDNFVRPYVGDILVVILIYSFLRSFFIIRISFAVILVLAFSFFVEFLQYLNFISWLGLESSTFARIVLGNSFSPEDLGMYLIGAALVLIIEKIYCSQRSVKAPIS